MKKAAGGRKKAENSTGEIRPVELRNGAVIILDQTRLPHEEVYLELREPEAVAEAIRSMKVRGAPAIGVTAAMAIAMGCLNAPGDKNAFFRRLHEICRLLAETRPTAVNLFWAVERMKKTAEAMRGEPVPAIRGALVDEALLIARENEEADKKISRHGSSLIEDGSFVLTHCNAGALATAGYGTALGVIRAALEEGKRITVFVDETRPFLQGARLTTWELARLGVTHHLITDNMAGYFMKKGEIDLVIVGADRIAANGDVANKIGTYSLSVLARAHGIPFYVAAPFSTFDLSIGSGDAIPIEERSAEEVIRCNGVPVAPEGTVARNPAFDVTPAGNITAIITESGILRPPYIESIRSIRSHIEAGGTQQMRGR